MNKEIYQKYLDMCNQGAPRAPNAPVPPRPGSTAAQHRAYADYLEAHERAMSDHRIICENFRKEKGRLYDAVVESIKAEYRNSGFNDDAITFVFNYVRRDTPHLPDVGERMGDYMQFVRDINHLNAGVQI